MGFEGGMRKNMALKGGVKRKNSGFKGRVTKKIL